jgi:hypothetical protein
VLKKGITGKKELNSRSIEKSEETKVVKKSPKKISPKKISPKKISPKKISPKKISPKKISPKKISPRITSISPVRPIIKVGDINGLLEEYRQPSTIVDKIQMFLKSN